MVCILLTSVFFLKNDFEPFSEVTLTILVGSDAQLRLLPILDGQAVLYSFVNTTEVRIGLAFGTGSQSTPQMELPMLSSWLVSISEI